MINGTILSFHMIQVDSNARLCRRMNEAATNYSASCGREGSPPPRLAGHGSGCSALSVDLSPEKSAEIKSVQCSVFSVQCPHLSQDIHIRAANVGTGALCHRPSALLGLDSPAGSIYLH